MEKLIAKRMSIKNQIDILTSEMKELDELILSSMDEGKMVIDNYSVTKMPNVRFNEDLARTVLNRKQIKDCTVVVEKIDSKRVKVLYPEIFPKTQKNSGYTLRMKEI